MWRLLLQTYFNFFVIGYAIDLLAFSEWCDNSQKK